MEGGGKGGERKGGGGGGKREAEVMQTSYNTLAEDSELLIV